MMNSTLYKYFNLAFEFTANFKYSLTEPISLRLNRLLSSSAPLHLPKISICIPTYNRGQILIERALKSVISQTYKNIEIVIVGDCCTDNTESLVRTLNDSRIFFYNLPNRNKNYPITPENNWLAGPVTPLNKCLEVATGKWIARIDDDDTWSDDHLEKLLFYAIQGNYEFVSALYEEERHGKISIIDGVHALDEYYTRKKIKGYAFSPKIGGVSTWLYKSYLRSMKYNQNCWRKRWNRVNDIDLSLRMYNSGVRMGFLNEVLAYVKPRPGENTVGLDAYLTKGLKNDTNL
jgi:glycosyltransferase involved in cell wall biosynthesis